MQIAAELTRRGEKFSHQNIGLHKRNHLVRENPALQQTIQELEQEALMAPPTVAAVYHVLIGQLKMLENARPSAETAIKAAEAISRITGMRTQQALLIAYAERAFNGSNALTPETEVSGTSRHRERAFSASQPTTELPPAATDVRQLEAPTGP